MSLKISVIIPARNEADHLPLTVSRARLHCRAVRDVQIIVVDGGSTDSTRDTALRWGADVVSLPDAPPGRAALLNHGVRWATGDVLLFCDADTVLPKGYDADISQALDDPQVVGGAFEFSLDGAQFGLRVVEWINRAHYRLRPRYGANQGIFGRREVVKQIGGYPASERMESLDFCQRLARAGRLKLIPKSARTSPRRFLAGGIYRVLWSDIRLWWRNFRRRDAAR